MTQLVATLYANRMEVYNWAVANDVFLEYRGSNSNSNHPYLNCDMWWIPNDEERALFILSWT